MTPSDFHEFHEEYLYTNNGNARGKATIEALGLNREELAEMRRDVLRLIKDLIDCRKEFANDVAIAPNPVFVDRLAKIDSRLVQYAGDSAQYAAMVRSVLPAEH